MLAGTFVSPVHRLFLLSMSKMSLCQCWSTLWFRSWCCWKEFMLICRWLASFLWSHRLEFANGQMPNCKTLRVWSWTCFGPRSPCWWRFAGTIDHSAFSLLAFCEHLLFPWWKKHTLRSGTQLSLCIDWIFRTPCSLIGWEILSFGCIFQSEERDRLHWLFCS